MNTSKYVDYTPLPGSTITEAAVKATHKILNGKVQLFRRTPEGAWHCAASFGKPHLVAASFCDSYLKQVESLNSPDERNFRRDSVKMAPKPGQP